ncbi:MAG: hypothetical protein OXQ29_15855 [Rhodospirillaceae bacterium]|nr:hypothetical protein [Rhodospirillaceae bacterium]
MRNRHEPSRCTCGAWAEPPLTICRLCYAKIQDTQRSRGRYKVGELAGAYYTNPMYRLRQ